MGTFFPLINAEWIISDHVEFTSDTVAGNRGHQRVDVLIVVILTPDERTMEFDDLPAEVLIFSQHFQCPANRQRTWQPFVPETLVRRIDAVVDRRMYHGEHFYQ